VYWPEQLASLGLSSGLAASSCVMSSLISPRSSDDAESPRSVPYSESSSTICSARNEERVQCSMAGERASGHSERA
jgi:hypothetical protein